MNFLGTRRQNINEYNFIMSLINEDDNTITYPKKQIAELIGLNQIDDAYQGSSISINAFGNVIAIGGPNDNDLRGAIWIFRKNGSGWDQGTKLIIPRTTTGPTAGSVVALNDDGNVLVLGALQDNNYIGGAYVFRYNNTISTWDLGTKLTGSWTGIAQVGYSVAINALGDVIAVGGNSDNFNIGAVNIFRYQNGSWDLGTKLVGSNIIGTSNQGNSVSLNAKGDIMASGGLSDNSGVGAVWVFKYNSNSGLWDQGTKLIGQGSVSGSYLGTSVSLNQQGNILATGGYYDNNGIGATWIFKHNFSSNQWDSGIKLVASDTIGKSQQGFSVALNAVGNVLAVGGFGDNNNAGAVWIFIYNGFKWVNVTKLIGNIANGDFGTSVALNNEGNILAIGAPGYNGGADTSYVYSN